MTSEPDADWPKTLVALRPRRRLSALGGLAFYVSGIAALVMVASRSEIGSPLASALFLVLAIVAANGFALGQVRENRQFIVFPPWTCRVRSRWGFGDAVVFASETWRARFFVRSSWRTVVRCELPGPGLPARDLFRPLQGFDDLLRSCVLVGQLAEAAVRRGEVAFVVEGARCSPEQLAYLLRSCGELTLELFNREDRQYALDPSEVGSRHLTDTIKEAFQTIPALLGSGPVSRVGHSATARAEKAPSPGAFRVAAVVETPGDLPAGQARGGLSESSSQQASLGVTPSLALGLLLLWYFPVLVLPVFGASVILLHLGLFWSVALPLALWTASTVLSRSFAMRWQRRLFPLGWVAVSLRGIRVHGRFRSKAGREVDIASSTIGWIVRARTLAARCARGRPPPTGSFAYARFPDVEERLISVLGPTVRVAAVANESKAFVVVEGAGPVSEQDCRAVAAAALEIGEEWDARGGVRRGPKEATHRLRPEAVEAAAQSLFLGSPPLAARSAVKELSGSNAA